MGDIPELELQAHEVTAHYRTSGATFAFDLTMRPGVLTVVIGANGSGKSSLLRVLAGLLPMETGVVLVGGDRIDRLSRRKIATRLSILPQVKNAPPGLTVGELVRRGRYPHLGPFRSLSTIDNQCIQAAMEKADVAGLADRELETLSGGQAQRAWIAMVLAQDTPIILFDEPIAALDLAHQVEVLALCSRLAREGRTVVVVLHDLNLAAEVADRVVILDKGRVVGDGSPGEVITAKMLEEVFDVGAKVLTNPATGKPLIVPFFPS